MQESLHSVQILVSALSPPVSALMRQECTRQIRDLIYIYFTCLQWDPQSLDGPGIIKKLGLIGRAAAVGPFGHLAAPNMKEQTVACFNATKSLRLILLLRTYGQKRVDLDASRTLVCRWKPVVAVLTKRLVYMLRTYKNVFYLIMYCLLFFYLPLCIRGVMSTKS
jgi:hypothetical protein